MGVTPSVPLLSVGDPLTLTCMGKGCMTAFNFTWLFEGSPVNDSLVTVIDSTTSQLSVTSVTSSDFGKYTCQVASVHGTGTAEATVRDAGKVSWAERGRMGKVQSQVIVCMYEPLKIIHG